MSDQAAALRLIAQERKGEAAPERARGRNRLIAVASGKGGVGKSNIALNLSLELAWRGRATCLFDADLGMANAGILAGVNPRRNLGHVIREGLTIEEVMTKGPMGLRIIAGANGLRESADLPEEGRKRLLRAMASFGRAWDYCVIDAGAGVSLNVTAFLESADHCLVVVTPEPTSMADAFGLLKILSERNYPGRLSLVVNRARTIREARTVAERIVELSDHFLHLGVDWAGFVLEDAVVQRAVAKRAPFSAFQRSSRPARSLVRIADSVERGIEMDTRERETVAERLTGWLERMWNR